MNMSVRFGFDNPQLKAWLLLHQAYNLVSKCENRVFDKYGLSAEQHAVLMAIKYVKKPVTPTDIARWLDRNPNGISLIVNRMAEAGLVRATRDLRDRRSVRLTITRQGKEIMEQATIAGWKLTQEMLSGMKGEDLHTLIRLLEMVREKSFKYLNPEEELEEVKVNEEKNMVRFMKKVSEYTSSTEPEMVKEQPA
jgi:DNA-binding MarR family transcriptional regulator